MEFSRTDLKTIEYLIKDDMARYSRGLPKLKKAGKPTQYLEEQLEDYRTLLAKVVKAQLTAARD